jgi:ABC-type sugar transport system ATPase subunit
VEKRFPGVVALKNVSFDIRKGEVHAVVGENGAGKSTLMNILSGVYAPDGGTVEFEGRAVSFTQPREAQENGIAMIHQELSLSPHMPASENVYIGRMPRNRFGFIDRKKMNEECALYLRTLGVSHINPKTLVKNLSVSEMQLLEIAKAMSLNARMLIMDEPTSSLTAGEVEFLLEIVDSLRKKGVAILYISHKLEEIMRIADQITVLRDGGHIATRPKAEMDEQTMINLMVGRDFDQKARRQFMTDFTNAPPMLEVRGVSDMSGKVRDVSFTLHKGEVLGLTGLVGAGRTELLQTIFGAQQMKSGSILVDGREVKIGSTKDAIDLGMALIPEGRKIQGLFLKLDVGDNMIMAHLKQLRTALGLIDKKAVHGLETDYMARLAIKTPSLRQIVNNLSGGNQQKTIVARWLMNKPKILFMDEPTHGIDIGAKTEIYRIIDDLSKLGVSIILLSSELPEVLSLCDRIMVMHHGELRGVLRHDEADQVKIMSYTLETAEQDRRGAS